MLLALNVNNTVTTAGVFDGAELLATWRMATDQRKQPDEYAMVLLTLLRTAAIDRSAISDCAIASVVPTMTPVFEELARRYFEADPLVVGSGIRTGMRIIYDNPREVGADRVADAVAAMKLYGPPPIIVVDMGTATVLDAINESGDYVGGAIAAGLSIASDALFERAAKLYRVELEPPRSAIGKNTVEAMKSGLVLGAVATVEGLVERFKRELGGSATVVATGGWSTMIAQETDIFDHVDRHLALTGLRLLFELNRTPVVAEG